MLTVNGVKKYYPKENGPKLVLDNLSLTVGNHEFICLLGPSGCGKSTLLRMMSGLERPDEGTIYQDDVLVQEPQPKTAFVFQDYALFPWKTVLENVAYGMEVQRLYPKETCYEKAREYLQMVHLAGSENSYVHELSGGMRQRTAIARSLALEPDILFMDEPFGALDNFTRMELQDFLLDIYASRQMSVVFVTHDIDESIYLGEKIVIMDANPGKVHTVLEVKRNLVQDRTSDDFVLYRDQIYEAFNLVHEKNIDYYI